MAVDTEIYEESIDDQFEMEICLDAASPYTSSLSRCSWGELLVVGFYREILQRALYDCQFLILHSFTQQIGFADSPEVLIWSFKVNPMHFDMMQV